MVLVPIPVPVSLWLLVRSIATQVLGINIFDECTLDGSKEIQRIDQTTWLLLRPCSQLLADFKEPRIDLRRAELPAELTPPEAGETVLIEHFEAKIANKEWRAVVLALLRHQSKGCVVVTCEIDYQCFWGLCSREERLVLIQLAEVMVIAVLLFAAHALVTDILTTATSSAAHSDPFAACMRQLQRARQGE